MNFTTPIFIQKPTSTVNYDSELLLLGSCFAENIGAKFEYFKFKTIINPFGIIFNAVSLEKIMKRIVFKQYFTKNDLFFHNDLWHSFEVHSQYSNTDKEQFLQFLNKIIVETHNQLTTLSHCIITLGTSWVYHHNQSNTIVANCHKIPQKEFTKQLLSVDEITQSLKNTIALIHSINPTIECIITISPVRHSKDGFFENNVSKAHLFSAVYQMLNQQKIYYFPSYEIVMDELRDYRFFEKDMLHPNALAVDYIWKKFTAVFFVPETIKVMQDIDAIQKALQHKPFNPTTETHLNFLKNIEKKIATLASKIPHLKF
ncbi:GSCFA family protein [Flavobacterium croceum DSM 17960]|uniref:GSCFA family protein n=1 Tax=Flavobacterium croceum DSM 17960 TaxID=1121886 RepID=A0A2S4NA65_9FLAO|nr:GSCFA domain-containing protein [Flavobacterium croceum]POS02578.1 GSCFA family protein [Flavobacterium croceum DSM 17960]